MRGVPSPTSIEAYVAKRVILYLKDRDEQLEESRRFKKEQSCHVCNEPGAYKEDMTTWKMEYCVICCLLIHTACADAYPLCDGFYL